MMPIPNSGLYKRAVRRYRAMAGELGMDNTPLVDFSCLSQNPKVLIYAKDESQNLTNSIKIRSALFNMLLSIEAKPGASKFHFLDASSGNYALALAHLACVLGHKATLFMPESFAPSMGQFAQKTNITLFCMGITNAFVAREKAAEFAAKHPELAFLNQYSNDGTWLVHYFFTAEEMLSELNGKKLVPTHFVAGIGTGGTLVGIGRRLKETGPVRVIGVESKAAYSIRGIRCLNPKEDPEVYLNHKEVVDDVLQVSAEEANRFRLANSAIKCGTSSFANLLSCVKLSSELKSGVILTVLPAGAVKNEGV